MSYILRLCCIAIITAICAVTLRGSKSELTPLCLLAGGVIMFLYVFDYLSESIAFLKSFSQTSGIDSEIIRIIFKVIGIGFVVELTASSIKDMGFEGVADKLILCGKLVIFVVSIPIINAAYSLIVKLIGLV